jgi:hypothetical protein
LNRSCPAGKSFFDEIFHEVPHRFNHEDGFLCETIDHENKICHLNKDLIPFDASTFYPRDSISVFQLQRVLETTFDNISNETQRAISGNGHIINGSKNDGRNNFTQAMDFMLKTGLSPLESVLLLQDRMESFQMGYTCFKPAWSEMPQFNMVTLMSQINMQRIHDYFRNLVPPGSPSSPLRLREQIYDYLRHLLINELQLVDESRFNDITIGQDLTYITGLPAPAEYRNYQNRQILSEIDFPDKQLYALCTDIIITNGHLESIMMGKNILNTDYFKGYSPYIRRYLDLKHTEDNPSRIEPDMAGRLYVELANYYRSYNDIYSRREDGLSNYPHYSTNPGNPDNRYYWQYWLDSRIFPSEIVSGSRVIFEIGQMMNR